MMKVIRTNVIGFKANGVCTKCGKAGETIDDKCHACAAEHCYKYKTIGCNCDLSIHLLRPSDTYLPCLKSPICKAIKAKNPNWQEIAPLDEVPYSPVKVGTKWIITKDHITTEKDIADGAKSRVGYGNYDGNAKDLPYLFKLYDDDGELYYEGRSNNRDTEAAFRPLDWAMNDAGCTYIKYRQDTGKWEVL